MTPTSSSSPTGAKRLFVTDDGKNLIVTFILVSSLFFLWGFCNGMIDIMDKHFQEDLHLNLSQSAWVQFAHYLGYFLMSFPAGWLALRLGYKGSIISGLLLVALGGFWFIPATHIAHFWAFLLGVCLIASGLTFLETVANPYTTVLGPKEYGAARINIAQSGNSVGWAFGPLAGAAYFYSKDASGASTGSQTLWIPYTGVAIVVIILAVLFFFANVPDIKTADEYHIDERDSAAGPEPADRQIKRGLVYFLLLLNAVALIGVIDLIIWVIMDQSLKVDATTTTNVLVVCGSVLFLIAAAVLVPYVRKISHHSIWSHPHFSAATVAQFFYVAAQAGIFSFLINYITKEAPPMPQSLLSGSLKNCFELQDGLVHFSDKGAAYTACLGFLVFFAGRSTGAALIKKMSAHKVLGAYCIANVILCGLVFQRMGWPSVACVFLTYFFMSVMFPTIFALGIHGLGIRAKKASTYIVAAIMGGAILPKYMGHIADEKNMSVAFIVPLVCFAIIAVYAFCWPMLSQSKNAAVSLGKGH